MFMKKLKFILSVICSIYFYSSYSQQIDLTIADIRNSKGNLVMGIYKDQDSFEKETPYMNLTWPKSGKVINGVFKITFSVPPGTYGLSLLDDETPNNKMDYTWYSFPQEGFGFSNYYHKGWSKPKLSSFLIQVLQGKTTVASIKMRYM
jgi:uncharacterized protein (DUF2141 family)